MNLSLRKCFMVKDFDPYVSGQSTELVLSLHGEGRPKISWTDDLLTDEHVALARSIFSIHNLFVSLPWTTIMDKSEVR